MISLQPKRVSMAMKRVPNVRDSFHPALKINCIRMKDYRNLRKALGEEKEWPQLYMFKFIVPNQHGKVDKVVSMLPDDGEISFKHTKSLRHVSVTCKAVMKHPDEIIFITQNITAIGGVLAL